MEAFGLEDNKNDRAFLLRRLSQTPEIYRLMSSAAAGNSYLICSDDEVLVIDAPLCSEDDCRAFLEALDILAKPPEHIKLFFTHAHAFDFSLIDRYLPDAVLVFISAEEIVPTAASNPLEYQNARYRNEGYPEAVLKQWDARDEVHLLAEGAVEFLCVRDNDRIAVGAEQLKCIATPGHTSGHMCLLHEKTGWLFSGDTFLYDMLPCVGMWDESDSEIEIMLNSLQKLKGCAVLKALPAHGSIEGEFGKRLEEMEREYYVRMLHMYRLVYDHPANSAYELCRYFYQNSSNWNEALPQKKWHAMGEALSFLNYLRSRKYVQIRRGKNGIVNLPGKNKLTDN